MNVTEAMRCKEFVELVTDYLEGALSEEESARFDRHLEKCKWCGRYFDQMRVTITTVGRLDADSLSPRAKDALLHVFRDWNAERG